MNQVRLFLFCALTLFAGSGWSDLVLARRGAPATYAIALRPDATAVERFAAQELQTFLARQTSVELPIRDTAISSSTPVLTLQPIGRVRAPREPFPRNGDCPSDTARAARGPYQVPRGTDPRRMGTDPANSVAQMGTDPRQMGTDPTNSVAQAGTGPAKKGTDPRLMGTDPAKMGTDPRQMGTDPVTCCEECFKICEKDGVLSILSNGPRGVLYGVYELLERFGGCAWYTPSFEVVPKLDAFVVPNGLRIAERPVFALRETSIRGLGLAPEFAIRNRLNFGWLQDFGSNRGRYDAKLRKCHTFDEMLSPKDWFATHPEYFSEVNGRRIAFQSQLCLTNPEVLKKCTEFVLARIAESYPKGIRHYGISPNDWENWCGCAACAAIDQREQSHAGTLIAFVNAIAEVVEKKYPDVIIQTLAYSYARHPPAHLRPRANMLVCLCTIECDFARSLVESQSPENQRTRQAFQLWGTVPPKTGTDPRKMVGTDPGKTGTDPGKTGTDPSQTRGTVPPKMGTDPGKMVGTDPGKTGTDPGKTGTDPSQTRGTVPPKMGTDPGKMVGTDPGKTGTDPGKTGTDPSRGRVGVWDYVTNFGGYLHVWPNFNTIQQNLQFFRDCGVEEVYEQGNGGGPNDLWANIKIWLISKWLWNPDRDRDELLTKCFRDYFGPAASDIRAVFERLHALPRDTKQNPMICFENVFSSTIPLAVLDEVAPLLERAAQKVAGTPYAQRVAAARLPLDFTRALRAARPCVRRDCPPPTDGDRPLANGDRPQADGDRPRAKGDRPLANGDRPRADGDRPRADGDRPQVDGDRPLANGDRPRADGDRPREDGDRPHEIVAGARRVVALMDAPGGLRFADDAAMAALVERRVRALAAGTDLPQPRARVTFEEDNFIGYFPTGFKTVLDPLAADGKAIRLPSERESCIAWFLFNSIAMDPEGIYLVRLRVRTSAAAPSAEAFRVGLCNVRSKKSYAFSAPKVETLRKERYTWYTVGTFTPKRGDALWVDLAEGEAHPDVFIDQVQVQQL